MCTINSSIPYANDIRFWYVVVIFYMMYLTVRLPYISRSLERFIQKEIMWAKTIYILDTVSLPQQLLMSYFLSSYLWVFEIRRLILTHLVHLEIFSSLQSQHSVVICWNIVSVECIIQFGNYKGERDFSGKYHEVY